MSNKTFIGFASSVSVDVGGGKWEFPVAKGSEIRVGAPVCMGEDGFVRSMEDPAVTEPIVYHPAQCRECGTRPGAKYCHRCGRESVASIAKKLQGTARNESSKTLGMTKAEWIAILLFLALVILISLAVKCL